MEEEGTEGNGAAASAILAQALSRNRRAVQEEYLPSRDHSLSIGPFQAPETPGNLLSFNYHLIHLFRYMYYQDWKEAKTDKFDSKVWQLKI